MVLIYRVGLFPHDHLLAQQAPIDYENDDHIADTRYLSLILNQSQCLIMESRNLPLYHFSQVLQLGMSLCMAQGRVFVALLLANRKEK